MNNNKTMKIVILDGYGVNPGDLSWDGMATLGELDVYPRTTPSEVDARIGDADVVLTNKVVIGDALMQRHPSMRFIGVLATGYNVVDVDAARARGVAVCNIPSYSTGSVVQTTFAHILNILNNVSGYARESRDGKWSASKDFCYWNAPIHEISGMTLGIVGLGNIGRRVAAVALSFGMNVCAMTSKGTGELPEGVAKATWDELLAKSDIITLHCPLTQSTREMVNAAAIEKMKPGAILINTGRGQLVNEQDVAQALADGRLSAYGADVMCQEPPALDNSLLKAPNAFVTPHIAWATVEARSRLIDIAVANVKAFAAGGKLNRIV